ncbi:MAG: WG repeat-containing protein, partial [Bacteroidia bacterium]|nr:WG repeat-containing protein [Bacteroidia bacterium]
IGEFKAGLAEVRSGSKWGYINMNDSMVIPLKFEEAAPFSGDTALVVLNSKKYNLARNGNLSEFRIDSLKFNYTTYPHFVFGENLKGQWHVSSLNGNTVSLLYDRLERKGYDFFIGFNKKKQTLYIMGETATQKIEVPLEPGNRIVQYYGWAPDQDLCGVTRVNGKYGMYNVSNGSEVPAGFSEFKASGIGCQFKYNDEWYDVSGRKSDFSKNVYVLSATCSACKGTGGTSGRKIKVRVEGEKRYVPSSTKSVKSFEYATLPNGEKSKFITYTVYKEETVPGHYEKEPDTYVDEWEPGIPCTSCKGQGSHPMTVKWTGTGFETIH